MPASRGQPEDGRRGITRRRALAAATGGAFGLAMGGGGYVLGRDAGDEQLAGGDVVPFHGAHQAGIATPAQDRLAFGAFDLTLTGAGELRDLLRTWTRAAVLMSTGRPAGDESGPTHPLLPPPDTGEAQGLPASRLTITVGFGPSVFQHEGRDRFGLASRRPSALTPLGPLPGDQLEPERCDGDLCVQACADDPTVAFHAVRNLARIARGAAVLRWTQLGFGRTSSTSSAQTTPRNLFGFKDGTNNLHGEDAEAMRRHVWVGDDEPQRWMRGGTYLVTRRIRMLIETWDRSTLDDQEKTIGRRKLSGAPLTGVGEHDVVDLAAQAGSGRPRIPVDAHIRTAAPAVNDGIRILRRGYSYTDGIDARSGELDAGLFFISFQRDPARFAALQRRLGTSDALGEYIRHTGSALFAVPGGVRPGGFLGDGLF